MKHLYLDLLDNAINEILSFAFTPDLYDFIVDYEYNEPEYYLQDETPCSKYDREFWENVIFDFIITDETPYKDRTLYLINCFENAEYENIANSLKPLLFI